MWVFVNIDMPCRTRPSRLYREQLVSWLVKDGFERVNKTLYARHCSTLSNARMHKAKVLQSDYFKAGLSILFVSEQQISESYHYNGRSWSKNKEYALIARNNIEFL